MKILFFTLLPFRNKLVRLGKVFRILQHLDDRNDNSSPCRDCYPLDGNVLRRQSIDSENKNTFLLKLNSVISRTTARQEKQRNKVTETNFSVSNFTSFARCYTQKKLENIDSYVLHACEAYSLMTSYFYILIVNCIFNT